IKAFDSGDLAKARALQLQSVRLINTVATFRYLPAAKRLMSLWGCDCGSTRPPLESLSDSEMQSLLWNLRELGIIDESAANS
ncbi:MAG: hypothetical protein ACKO85_18890, partial [Isosphaeraceae bacterium]